MRGVWYDGGEMCIEVFMGHVKQRDPLEILGVDGRIILKWIFKKSVGMA
jgi:hypothetical protein